jgi:hypothetical protein
MKIRTGFVSNSSSSSFIAVGFSIKGISKKDLIEKIFDKDAEKLFEESGEKDKEYFFNDIFYDLFYESDYKTYKNDIEIANGTDGGLTDNDDVVIMQLLSSGSSIEELGDGSFGAEDIISLRNEVLKEFMEKLNINETKAKIYYGTKLF